VVGEGGGDGWGVGGEWEGVIGEWERGGMEGPSQTLPWRLSIQAELIISRRPNPLGLRIFVHARAHLRRCGLISHSGANGITDITSITEGAER
jgi:hypothetical protein